MSFAVVGVNSGWICVHRSDQESVRKLVQQVGEGEGRTACAGMSAAGESGQTNDDPDGRRHRKRCRERGLECPSEHVRHTS